MPAHPRQFDVLAIEDQDLAQAGLRTLPSSSGGIVRSITVVEHPRNVEFCRPPPDVVVLDFWLERERVPATPYIPLLVQWCPAVILYTSEERPGQLREALRAGVRGLCLKGDGLPALSDGIRSAAQGRFALSSPLATCIYNDRSTMKQFTEREREILMNLALGRTEVDIAELLTIAPKTVSRHIERIYLKLREMTGEETMNRTRALRAAYQIGEIPDPWREPR